MTDVSLICGHTFHIHQKWIDYDSLAEMTEARMLIDEELPVDDLYPFFMNHDELADKIEKVFPDIQWKVYGEFGRILTEWALVEIMIIPVEGKNEVRQNITVCLSFTDRPFEDVKRLCRAYGWYLWHLNSNSYLNIYDNRETEPDYFNRPESSEDL